MNESKTEPPPANLTNEDHKALAYEEMRANLYATVFNNCPGDDIDAKTKAATDAIRAFEREND